MNQSKEKPSCETKIISKTLVILVICCNTLQYHIYDVSIFKIYIYICILAANGENAKKKNNNSMSYKRR